MCNLKGVNRGVNRTIPQISLLLLLIVFFLRKCIRLTVKITEQSKCLFHNFYGCFSNYTDLKDLFQRVLNTNTRSFPFLAHPPPPPPFPLVSTSPSNSMLGSRVRSIAGPYRTRMQHLHVTIP